MPGGEIAEIPSIPLTAWQQGAMVVLFAVIFCAVLFFLLRWFSQQQQAWQKFIADRDAEWQKFLEAQRKSDQEQREQDRKIITRIADVLDQLTDRFGDHDTWERTKLEGMEKAITEPRTQPRKRTGD